MSPDLGSGVRKFDSGAPRDTDNDKLDFRGFFSACALERFAQYMNEHRKMAGTDELRASDNWKKGIPKEVYMSSAWRHFFDWWKEDQGLQSREGLENALCGLWFNLQGYLHEALKDKEKLDDTQK